VIVSVRSLLPVGDGRLETAVNLPESKYNTLLKSAQEAKASAAASSAADEEVEENIPAKKRIRTSSDDDMARTALASDKNDVSEQRRSARDAGGAYSVSEAEAAYSHLSDYHKKKGWDTSGWWARKG
jgi:ubiquitin-conjugating enzyme E2 Q